MFFRLLILFVVIPLIELAILTRLSEATSLGFTILVVLLTGIVGAALAKRQGLRTWYRINQTLARGQAPAAELVDGAMILVAGAVLLTPGLLTDFFGFLLLIPQSRRVIARALVRWFKARIAVQLTDGAKTTWFHASTGGETRINENDGDVIDADFERIPDEH